MDILQIKGISLFVIAFLNLILAVFVWSKSKNDKTKFWLGFMVFFSGVYAAACGGTYFSWGKEYMFPLLWHKATWLGVLMLPPFNIFAYYFTQNTKNLKLKAILFYAGAILIIILSFMTNLLELGAYLESSTISAPAGSFDWLGRIYIFIGLITALINLSKGYLSAEQPNKKQLWYFILGTTIFATIGIITTSVIPFFTKVSSHYDIAAYFSFLWVVFIAYSIFRYKLFDIRIFANELLTFGVWILLFIRIVFSRNYQDLSINITLSILITILGILFLKSIYKENELTRKMLGETKRDLDLEKRLRQTFAELSEEKIKRIEQAVFSKNKK